MHRRRIGISKLPKMCLLQNDVFRREPNLIRNLPEFIPLEFLEPDPVAPAPEINVPRIPKKRGCKVNIRGVLAVLALFVIFAVGFGFWYISRHVQWPIVANSTCWNSDETLIASVQKQVTITAVGIECKKLPPQTESSYIKDFNVIGYSGKDDEYGFIIGKYQYDRDFSPFQYIKIRHTSTFDRVGVRIISNWGDPNVTCVESIVAYGRVIEE